MKLIPVDAIPKVSGYHKLQDLIEEFVNGDAKIVKVDFGEDDYKSPTVCRSCLSAAIGADPDLYQYLIRGVTEGLSYDALKMKYDIPCCRDVYYAAYRRFFWLLSKRRD